MKSLLLCLLLSCLSHPLVAKEVTITDLIHFEEKIDSLLSESISLTEDPSSGSTLEKIHQFTNNLGHQLLDELAKDKPLNGYQLSIVNLAIGAYITIADNYQSKLNHISPQTIKSDKDAMALRWMSLQAELVQSFKQTYELFYRNTSLRRVLKDQSLLRESNLQSLKVVTQRILNKELVKKLEVIIRKYQSIEKNKERNAVLKEKLESSIIFQKIEQDKSLKEFYTYKAFSVSASDGLSSFMGTITSGISAGFGALVGPIELRQGYLKGNKKAQSELLNKLKPLDLLLEKKSYKLTDYTIPGHWGHIGVWLGTEEQLKEIGLWESDFIRPFQEKIRAGFSIYEVRRWGLVWEKLETWMNLDAMAVLRHDQVKNYGELEYSKVFTELFSQIGKKYDYSFDAMTANTITCTEIISLSYGPVNWPTTKVIGRHTLQPDNIAALSFFENSPIEFVAYLKGSEKGYEFKRRSKFAKLIDFYRLKSDPSRYKKHMRKCERTKYRVNGRGPIRFKNNCWSEFEAYKYEPPFDHLENDIL